MTYANYETRTIETSEGEKMVFESVDAMYKYLKQSIKPMARMVNLRPRGANWPYIFKGITK
jgi:hypothetical protein